jgi:hypothetical protein
MITVERLNQLKVAASVGTDVGPLTKEEAKIWRDLQRTLREHPDKGLMLYEDWPDPERGNAYRPGFLP